MTHVSKHFRQCIDAHLSHLIKYGKCEKEKLKEDKTRLISYHGNLLVPNTIFIHEYLY